jgi:hypothetical protein
VDEQNARWYDRFVKSQPVELRKVDGAVIVKVAPHAQDGLEALNTRRRAQRQLFSKKAHKKPLKRLGNDQYHDDR